MTDSIGITAAFIGGLLSFLSPCVLPLVPAYLSYISGVSVEEMVATNDTSITRRIGVCSIIFVAGFSLVFVLMGAGATWIGQVLTSKLDIISKIAGAIVVIFGFHVLGVIRIKALYSEKRLTFSPKNMGLIGAFLIGMTFAFAWTPCIGPILASILALAAESKTVAKGVALLAVYSAGLGIPFIVTGFATGAILSHISRVKGLFRAIEIISGLLLITIGILIITGGFQAASQKLIGLFA